MTFDEQLTQAFETLTDRLRDDVDREVRRVIDELTAAQAERERIESDARERVARAASQEIASAIATARQQAHDEGREAGKEEGRQRGVEEGRRQGVAEGQRQGLEEGRQQGVEAGLRQGVEEGRQQAADEARGALEAAAAAVAAAQHAARTVDLAASARLAEAVRSIGRGKSLSEILDTLVTCAGREATRAGVWLVRGGGFRSWRAVGFGDAIDHEQRGQSVELSFDGAGVIADAARTNEAASGDGPGAPRFAALPPGRMGFAVPIAMSGQVVAVLYADQGNVAGLGTTNHEPGTTNAEPGTLNPEPSSVVWPDTLEVLTRYAARCLEAVTAFKAARALTERPGESDVHAPGSRDEVNLDEEASARRYARLLVSEIKLYHESAVVEGRRDRDLAKRLGGEIAHARVLYEQRVPPGVRRRADYFQDELVRTLADGDATMLELKA
ncbi:MAG: hypothetical protein DMF94_20150 [Acidobacteria bacterium]|nr:MAG: hypothetical protein DMF94_20150 [Acidobacteriota bacterium]